VLVPVLNPRGAGLGATDVSADSCLLPGFSWLETSLCQLGIYDPYGGIKAPPAPPLSQGVPEGALEAPYTVTTEAVERVQREGWQKYQQELLEFAAEQEQRDVAWQETQDRWKLSLGLGLGTAAVLGGVLLLVLLKK